MTGPDHAPRWGGVPTSRCDDRCVAPGPRSAASRAVRRGAAVWAVLALALTTAPLLVLPLARVRRAWLRTVAGAALAAVGVTVRVRDARGSADASRDPGSRGALLVANHVSWIEVVALLAVLPVRLVAKDEIRRWPVVGPVARATGALFLDRSALRALPRSVATMTAALAAGDVVAAFPEGTTWCGRAAGPFRRAVFQAALDAGVPIRPVAVALRCSGRTAHEGAFVGEQALLGSVRRVLRVPALVCELTLLPALAPVGTRTELADRAAAAIGAATGVPHPGRVAPALRPRAAQARRSGQTHDRLRQLGPRHGGRPHLRRHRDEPQPAGAAVRDAPHLDAVP